MKPKTIAFISIGGTLSILAFFLIVPVIIMNLSWWWFFLPLIILIVIGLVVGLIIFLTKLNKKSIVTKKISLKDARARVIYDMKHDEDNPDNFKIDYFLTTKEGDPKFPKTPVVTFYGTGTENNENRAVVVNLNNPKQETSMLIDKQEDEIKEARRLIADNPSEEIKEETTIGMDNFGRPITTTKTTRPSQAERKAEEEKKEAEVVNSL